MPDIIQRLKDAYITGQYAEIIKTLLPELFQATDEGKIIELPCKVGDTVYTVEKERNEHGSHSNVIVSHEVIWFEIVSGQVFAHITSKRGGYAWRCDMFGKTVFLTREAAEAALQERET